MSICNWFVLDNTRNSTNYALKSPRTRQAIQNASRCVMGGVYALKFIRIAINLCYQKRVAP